MGDMKLKNPFLTRGYAGADYFCDLVYETDAGWVVYDRLFGLWLKRN